MCYVYVEYLACKLILFVVCTAPKQQEYVDASSVAKRSEEIEMEENTAYGPIGSAGAHPTTTQAPVYEEVASKQEWVIQIPSTSIPILVSVLFPSLHLKYFRIKFLLLVLSLLQNLVYCPSPKSFLSSIHEYY